MTSPENDVDSVITDWVTLPDAAELMDVSISQVRSLIEARLLVAVRRGSPKVFMVPRAMVEPEPCDALPGTMTLLLDARFSLEGALIWLFTEDASLPGTPWEALRAGRKTEVRRRAQALLV